MEREQRDSRYLENYEKSRKRWQKYATIIAKKVGKKGPEHSIINYTDLYPEILQRKEYFDQVQDGYLHDKINNFYGSLRLSPLDTNLRPVYIATDSFGNIDKLLSANNSPHKAGPQIKNTNDLFIKGTNKLDSELEYAMSVPENSRYFVKLDEPLKEEVPSKKLEKVDLHLDSLQNEEIIVSNFESKTLY